MTAPTTSPTPRATAPQPPVTELPQAALLVRLRAAGVSDTGLLRLVRLRAACRRLHPALDGFTPDARARFARWLYERGRLRD